MYNYENIRKLFFNRSAPTMTELSSAMRVGMNVGGSGLMVTGKGTGR
jgi:hypothetical protein